MELFLKGIFTILFYYLFIKFIYETLEKIIHNKRHFKSNNKSESYTLDSNAEYYVKPFMSKQEISFYNKIKDIDINKYIVLPQINLAAIINKKNAKFHNELFRNVDYGIFNKNFELLLLIELNDHTHESIERKDRDLKVKKIVKDCNIKLLTFYTKYPNEKDYVIKRILNVLNSDNSSVNNNIDN